MCIAVQNITYIFIRKINVEMKNHIMTYNHELLHETYCNSLAVTKFNRPITLR